MNRLFVMGRVRLALCLPLALVVLTGCQGERIVARVNNEAILEKDFQERAISLTKNDIPGTLDAGGTALVRMIQEKLITQLAESKKVTPNEEDVKRLVNYLRRRDPNINAQINSGARSEDSYLRQVRQVVQEFAIGTEGRHLPENDIKAEYEKAKDQLKVPEMWTVRILPAASEDAANQALEMLKKNGDFRAVAQAMRMAPQDVEAAARENVLPRDSISPALRDALAPLKDREFTAKPVVITGGNPPQTAYFVAQMMSRKPEYMPKLDEVKSYVEQRLLEQLATDWVKHKDQALAQFTKKALEDKAIQVNVARYKPVVDAFMRQMADAFTALPSNGIVPPGGAAPGNIPQPEGAGAAGQPMPQGNPGAGGTAPPPGNTPAPGSGP